MHGRAFTSINGTSAVAIDGRLTIAADTWQRCLLGVTELQIARGLKKLTESDKYDDYSITATQFRSLCVERDDVPSVEQIVQILANSVPRQGTTVAERFQHPIALAVMQHARFDYHVFKTASTKACIDMIKPIHADLMQSAGWDDFKPEHYSVQRAITSDVKRDKSVAMNALAGLKGVLGA